MNQEHKDFFDRNPDIQLLHWTSENELQIYHVKGDIENVDLNNDDDVQKAISKYGKLPQLTESYFDARRLIDSVLFIVDNKEIDSSYLSKLDVMQIESINILKDSSATNQYGSRASHGVIIITTKKTLEKNKPAMNKKDNYVSFESSNNKNVELKSDSIILDKKGLRFSGKITIDHQSLNTNLFRNGQNW